MDNIFVERLWRSLKYEEVYLNAYATVAIGNSAVTSAGGCGLTRFVGEKTIGARLRDVPVSEPDQTARQADDDQTET